MKNFRSNNRIRHAGQGIWLTGVDANENLFACIIDSDLFIVRMRM
jgi:hypothetical protein